MPPCNFTFSEDIDNTIQHLHHIPRLTPPSFLYQLQNTTLSSHNNFQFFDLDYYVVLVTTAVGYHVSAFLFFTLVLGLFLCFTTCCNPDHDGSDSNRKNGRAVRRNRRERPCAFCVNFILHVLMLVFVALITMSPAFGSITFEQGLEKILQSYNVAKYVHCTVC